MTRPRRDPILIVLRDAAAADAARRELAAALPEADILACSDATEAAELAATTRFAIAVCQLDMPVAGVDLLVRIRERHPRTLLVLAVADATADALIEAVNRASVWKIIRLPWRTETLVEWVSEALRPSESGNRGNGGAPAARLRFRAPAAPAPLRLRPAVPSAAAPPPSPPARRTFAPPIPLPRVAPRYVDLKLIDPAGHAALYRARDTLLNLPVALKVLSPKLAADEKFSGLVLVGAREAARLTHPCVARVLTAERHGPVVYLVAEYVKGATLRRVLAHYGKLAPDAVMTIVRDAASVLDHAVARRLCHLDLRLEKLMLDQRRHLKVVGFGFGPLVGALPPPSGSSARWHHISPERAAGEPAGPAADVYALAIAAHELLAGALPDHDGRSEPDRPEAYCPVAADELPAPVREVINRGLARQPADRWATAGEFAAALMAALRDSGGVPQ